MKREFSYAPQKGIMSYLIYFIIAALFIAVPLIHPFVIQYGDLPSLPLPYSQWILILIGVCIIVYQLNRIFSAQKHRKLARPIVVDNDEVIFIYYANSTAEKQSFHLSQVSDHKYSITDGELTIYADSGHKYKFYQSYFDTKAEFDEFRIIFNNK